MMSNGRERADDLARGFVEVLGEEVVSVILYGSAARDEYREGSSDLNVLVVLRTVDEAVLRSCGDIARAWAKGGDPPPLLLGADELRRSLDIFPIEYSDIRDSHRVLHGEDPFIEIEIDPEHLRLQCERELKTALIQLRERYLLVSEEPTEVGDLFRSSISTFLVHFRTLLRLQGESIPNTAESVVRAIASKADFAPDPVLAVLKARHSKDPFSAPAGDAIAVGYLAAAARVVEYADGIHRLREPTPGAE